MFISSKSNETPLTVPKKLDFHKQARTLRGLAESRSSTPNFYLRAFVKIRKQPPLVVLPSWLCKDILPELPQVNNYGQ